MSKLLGKNLLRFGVKNLSESTATRLHEGATPWSVDDGSALNVTAEDLTSITSALQSTLKNRAKMGLQTGASNSSDGFKQNAIRLTLNGKNVQNISNEVPGYSKFVGYFKQRSTDEHTKRLMSDYLLKHMRKFDKKTLNQNIKAQQAGGDSYANVLKNNIIRHIYYIYGVRGIDQLKNKKSTAFKLAKLFATIIPLKIYGSNAVKKAFDDPSNNMTGARSRFYEDSGITQFESFLDILQNEATRIAMIKTRNFLKNNNVPSTGRF